MNLKRLAIVFFALVLLLVVVPFLIPMGAYISQIEQTLAGKLGVPVKIGSLHFALLPTPRANIGNLVIGNDGDIQVGDIAAVLDVATLFDDVRVISTLKLDAPVLKPAGTALLGSLAGGKDESPGTAPVELRRIVVNDAKVEVDGLQLPGFDAKVELSPGGKLQHATLTSSKGNLAVDLVPAESGYAATIKAEKWTPPAGPQIVFDTLKANLEYAGSTLKFSQIEATLYRGKLTASGQMNWARNWHLEGKFKTEGIELGDAARLFTRTVKVTGRISGDGKFSSTAKDAGKLGEALALDYNFNVANGVLYGVDLVKAASLLLRQGQTGGETHFDALSGALHTRGKHIEVRPLHIVSGLLAADGNVSIAADRKLGGKIDAEIKKGVALVTVPLQISGTMDKPIVLPTKAALAGAAAGTALMGPLGTDLGIKAGSALDKMFGRDD